MRSGCLSLSVGFLLWTPASSSNRSEQLFTGNWSELVGVNSSSGTEPRTEPPRAPHRPFSPYTMVLLALLMTLLVAATVLGNALVILCFLVEKRLRNRGNFFFLNLAIADFLVAGFCIPVYIPYVLTGEWRMGRGLCKLWLVVDYTLCTASVFNIVLISFDRFMSVTKALSYQCQKGISRGAVLKMLSVWLAAFLLYGPAIISWEYATGHSVVPDHQCHAEFYFNWYFLMTASMFEFFTPFITVTYFNVSIYLNIRRRNLMRGDDRIGNEGGTPPAGRRPWIIPCLNCGHWSCLGLHVDPFKTLVSLSFLDFSHFTFFPPLPSKQAASVGRTEWAYNLVVYGGMWAGQECKKQFTALKKKKKHL
uniref:Histamine receptor H3 n=1 Tax=Myripristis murdjan TaxID=586833 RepID=A0A667YV70_9TELE